MRKTVLALAASAALGGYAHAQSNVTVYGFLDTGVGISNAGGSNTAVGSARNTHFMSLGGAGSNIWGFRGGEDLGGGLSATFVLEGQFTPSNGAMVGPLFTRRSIVGLAGPWGQLTMGRDWTPAFWMGLHHDINKYAMLGNTLTYWSGNGTRSNNGIFYNTPKWNGLFVRTMVSTGDWDTATGGSRNEGKYVSIGAEYAPSDSGFTGSAYYNHRTGGRLAASGSVALLGGRAGVTDDFGIGGGYKGNGFRVAGGYSQISPEAPFGKLSMVTAGVGLQLFKTDELTLQYLRVQQDVPIGLDPKADVFSVSYAHSLSKRTKLYATAGIAKNNQAGTFSLYSAAQAFTPLSAGGDPRAVLIGINHAF